MATRLSYSQRCFVLGNWKLQPSASVAISSEDISHVLSSSHHLEPYKSRSTGMSYMMICIGSSMLLRRFRMFWHWYTHVARIKNTSPLDLQDSSFVGRSLLAASCLRSFIYHLQVLDPVASFAMAITLTDFALVRKSQRGKVGHWPLQCNSVTKLTILTASIAAYCVGKQSEGWKRRTACFYTPYPISISSIKDMQSSSIVHALSPA